MSARVLAGRPTAQPALIQLGVELLEERHLLSVALVANTTQFPYSAVVRIESTFTDSQGGQHAFVGSGALIDPFHVLTAGHMVYQGGEGWATQLLVFPGQRDANTLPFGEAFGTVERTYSQLLGEMNQNVYDGTDDIGLITLDRPVGNSTGWFNYGFNSDAFFQGVSLHTSGYPADLGYSGNTQYQQYGPILGLTPDGTQLVWDYRSLTSINGQSGSPLWYSAAGSGQAIIYGVLVAGDDQNQLGYADRITPSIYVDLQRTTRLDPVPLTGSSTPPVPTHGTLDAQGVTAGPGVGLGGQGVGSFDPATATWYLNTHEATAAPNLVFQYGLPGWVPVVGDWNGTGQTGIGVFDPSTATWYLRNEDSAGPPDAGVFQYGLPGCVPVVGDWDGDGKTTIGVFDPRTDVWYLRNENSAGLPDAGVFPYGLPGWVPVVGDWNGDGKTTVGVFDPSTATWYLRNENSTGLPDAGVIQYGLAGWVPVVGRWDGGLTSTVGVIDPGISTWFLRNSNNTGVPTTTPFFYGWPSWVAVVGDWQGQAPLAAPVLALDTTGSDGIPGERRADEAGALFTTLT